MPAILLQVIRRIYNRRERTPDPQNDL